ncbi:hypothetical protein HNR42_000325 [Deinobacterium chartae]|uniref:DUF4900 domain-containing protein n=1 Tax=Deinobacterium chartae TaxID=521158 RepID=A0A841HVQ3_9DEIO|nr:hypothetical protein [Deinobacterium chartae]MBB6096913.1 hypothetical protein [Deinobacterium chartae]
MRTPERRQRGMALVTVLTVSLLTLALVTGSLWLAGAARGLTADSNATQIAQYAAESGIQRGLFELSRAERLLIEGLQHGLESPKWHSLTKADLEKWVRQMCGVNKLHPAQVGVEKQACKVTGEAFKQPAQVELFTQVIPTEVLEEYGVPAGPQYWIHLFSGSAQPIGQSFVFGQGSLSYTTRPRLRPLEVLHDGYGNYELVFRVERLPGEGQLKAGGEVRASRRMLFDTEPNPNSHFRLRLSRDALTRYALFVNRLTGEGTNTKTNFYDSFMSNGPVRTNDVANFVDSDNGGSLEPWFGGGFSSAGCTQVNADGTQCTGTYLQGAYDPPNHISMQSMKPVHYYPVFDLGGKSKVAPTGGAMRWDAPFLPLPDHQADQKNRALEGGLFVEGDVSDLYLSQDGKDQFITLDGIEYRLDSLGYLSRLEGKTWKPLTKDPDSPEGAWKVYEGGPRTPFNGVIHVTGKLDNLRGPERNPWANKDSAPAALAAHARLTVSVVGDVTITRDLKYATPPCTSGNVRNGDGSVTPANCPNLEAANMLGIYSHTGDVLIANNKTSLPAPNNAPSNLQLHAAIMASRGELRVPHGSFPTPDKGQLTLLGALIENTYGAIGGGNFGYRRDFIHDPRLALGDMPPHFPTQKNWDAGLKFYGTLDFQNTTYIAYSRPRLTPGGDWKQVGP